MTVTLAYDVMLSRVRVAADGLGTAATATVERSTDLVRWSTVRGAADVSVVAGALVIPVDDYEFSPDVLNHYRVSYPAALSFVAAGAAAHAVNAAVVPGLPAGLAAGDALFVLAAIRNSPTGAPDTPDGYTLLLSTGNLRLFGKIAGSSESAPTVTFTGGVAGADTTAQMAAVRGADLEVVSAAAALNTSAQNIACPATAWTDPIVEALVLHLGWRQDDWTSVAPVADGTEIGEPDTTAGDDQGITWAYRIITPTAPFTAISARTFTVTGGAAAISRGAVVVSLPAAANQVESITPVLGDVWLKSVGRPFLNRPLPACDIASDVVRPSRGGSFTVVGRSLAVAVTDVRGGREFALQVLALTAEDAQSFDLALAGGDVMYLHTPADFPEPSMYCTVGEYSKRILSRRPWRAYTLPLAECAAPVASIVGATATYQTVLSAYATYEDLLATHATYASVLELVADPSEVIVP